MPAPRVVLLPIVFPSVNVGLGEYDPRSGVAFMMDDTFGDSRASVGVATHQASDLICARGTVIVSATHAEVIASSWAGVGGWAVTTAAHDEKGGRYMFHYAHMIAPSPVKVGQKVSAGDFLGLVGNTGGSLEGVKKPWTMDAGPPHLHFGMFGPDGLPPYGTYNPYQQLIALSSPLRDRWFRATHDDTITMQATSAAMLYVASLTLDVLQHARAPLYGDEATRWAQKLANEREVPADQAFTHLNHP